MSNGDWRHERFRLGAAAVFAGFVIVCAIIAPRAAAAGWLIGFVLCSQVCVGSLLLLMIHRLTGGRWGEAVRPVLEPAAAAIPSLLVLVIPVFVAIPALFPWAHPPGGVKPDVLGAYLNTPFFIVRSLIVLAVWSVLAFMLPRLPGSRGELVAAVGLAFYCLAIGPIGFDWFLSLEPPFQSSSFGASVAVTQLIAALAFALLSAPITADDRALGDLGGLLLAFVLGLTYLDFMALLVIWYGDVPATTRWFVEREGLTWWTFAWASFLLVVIVPVFCLFVSRLRRSRTALRCLGASALLGLLCYNVYQLAPPFGPAALIPALLSTIAIGLLIIALARGFGSIVMRRRAVYGE